MQQKMELTRQSSSENNLLEILIQEKWIDSKTEAVIYFTNSTNQLSVLDDKEQNLKLTDLLLEWRMMIGVHEEVTSNEMLLNINWIKEQYSSFTPEKIREAYKSSLKGLLYDERDKPLDIKPYGKFSPMYISMILNAYIEYEKPIYRKILHTKNKLEQFEIEKIETIESRRKYIQYYLSKVNTDCKEMRFVQFNFIIYLVMLKNNIIDKYSHKDISDEELSEYYPDGKTLNMQSEIYPFADVNKKQTLMIHHHLSEWFKSHSFKYEELTDDNIYYER